MLFRAFDAAVCRGVWKIEKRTERQEDQERFEGPKRQGRQEKQERHERTEGEERKPKNRSDKKNKREKGDRKDIDTEIVHLASRILMVCFKSLLAFYTHIQKREYCYCSENNKLFFMTKDNIAI